MLASDTEFRREFFRSPRTALRNRGMSIDEKVLQEIEQNDWHIRTDAARSFKSVEVLRCSVGF
jgi:hypothetical protein